MLRPSPNHRTQRLPNDDDDDDDCVPGPFCDVAAPVCLHWHNMFEVVVHSVMSLFLLQPGKRHFIIRVFCVYKMSNTIIYLYLYTSIPVISIYRRFRRGMRRWCIRVGLPLCLSVRTRNSKKLLLRLTWFVYTRSIMSSSKMIWIVIQI